MGAEAGFTRPCQTPEPSLNEDDPGRGDHVTMLLQAFILKQVLFLSLKRWWFCFILPPITKRSKVER